MDLPSFRRNGPQAGRRDRATVWLRRAAGLALLTSLIVNAEPFALAQAAQGQAPADVFDDRIVVREATVHVRVRSKRGPITGLSPDRFSVRLGNTTLPIIGFDELRTEARKRRRGAEPQTEPQVLLGRNLLVVFDVRFTPRPYLIDAVRATRRSLDDLGPEDRMAVVLWRNTAQLILPFSNDPLQLDAAFEYVTASLDAKPQEAARAARLLGTLSNEPSTRLSLGLRAELTRRSPSIADSVDFTFVNQFADFDPAESLRAAELAQINELAGLIERSNVALADLARTLSDVAGPRHAVLFGKGVPGFQSLIQGRAAWDAGTISSITNSFNALTYRLRGNGWVVDTVDVTGVGGLSTAVSMADSAPRTFDSQSIASTPQWVQRGGLAGNDSDSLFLIAEQTGGDMYDNRNSLRDALRQSLEASSHAYRLVVQIPPEAGVEARRGSVRLNVDVRDLPARAKVRHSFGADWAIPAHLRKANEVETAHAELVGTRRAKPLPPLLAHMTVHRRPDDSGPRLQRALVALDLDPALLQGAGRLSLIAVASPLEAEGGDGSVFDLWTEEFDRPRDDNATLLAYADLLVPCSGARIRLRVATDANTSWLGERVLGDGCAEATFGALWPRAEPGAAKILAPPDSKDQVVGSRSRLTVLAGQSLDVGFIDPAVIGDSALFLLAPLGEDGPVLERRASRSHGAADGATFTLTFDVPPGHYEVRSAEAQPTTAALISVF